MTNRICLLASIGLLLICSGCGPVATYAGPEATPVTESAVAVLPFRSLAGHPNGGAIVAELLQDALVRRGERNLIPRELTQERLASLQGQDVPVDEIGTLLDAPYLFVGTVTEYGYRAGPTQQPAVGVTVRLVEAKTGRVAWSVTLARTGGAGWLRETSLSQVAQDVAETVAARYAQR